MTETTGKGHDRAAERTRIDWLLRRFCGVPRSSIERATAAQLRGHLESLDRRLARERNKGAARHWGYDLNRHIALKQTRDVIMGALTRQDTRRTPKSERAQTAASASARPSSAEKGRV